MAAIKDGAFDFIEKPFDEARLLASIRRAVKQGRHSEAAAADLEELQSRFNALSVRQRQVMELAVAGLSSKEIAIQLNISPRTVGKSSRLGDGAHWGSQLCRTDPDGDEEIQAHPSPPSKSRERASRALLHLKERASPCPHGGDGRQAQQAQTRTSWILEVGCKASASTLRLSTSLRR